MSWPPQQPPYPQGPYPQPIDQPPAYPQAGYASAGFPPSMLQYAGADMSRRPGLLTALGICSVVFASLALLYNGLMIAGSVYELATLDDWNTPSLANTSADTTPRDTLSERESKLIASALAELQPLTDDEQHRLAEALRRTESPVAPPLAGVPWSADHVKQQVVASATHLPGQPFEADEGGAEIEIGDGEQEQGDDQAEPATQAVYEQREIHFDFDMNGDIYLYDDRVHVYALPMDGRELDSIVHRDGSIEVDADTEGFYDDSTERARLWLTLAAELLALGLAVLLLVAGILTLRDVPAAARLHHLWAWSRMVLSVLAAGLGAWAVTQLYDPNLGEVFLIVMIVTVATQLLFSVAYAVAVLIVLRLHRVRNWYSGAAATAPPPASPGYGGYPMP